jgi:CubicO group peptidase (beta-lactamase class C family)
MSAGGFSKARLGRMHDVMGGYVERGEVPGMVTLVSRRGEVHVNAMGAKAAGGSDPMRRDTIFRIASRTKPITAAATMILVEECKLRLDEPVDRLLPKLANRKVLNHLDGSVDDTAPARRPITVRDLLTFRSGYGFILGPGAYPIQKAMAEARLTPGPNPPQFVPYEYMRRLGGLPLAHQPGEKWMCHTGCNVLGVLIARASGQAFETFLHERIFEPLGLKDTAFFVPTAKLERFATSYWTSLQTGATEIHDELQGGLWSRPPAFASGGGGLVSTVDDYFAFGQMMLNKGKWGSQRILSRPSSETMTSDHLTPAQKAVSGLVDDYLENHGWGFGMTVVTRRVDLAGPVGQYGWDGAWALSGVLTQAKKWLSSC